MTLPLLSEDMLERQRETYEKIKTMMVETRAELEKSGSTPPKEVINKAYEMIEKVKSATATLSALTEVLILVKRANKSPDIDKITEINYGIAQAAALCGAAESNAARGLYVAAMDNIIESVRIIETGNGVFDGIKPTPNESPKLSAAEVIGAPSVMFILRRSRGRQA